MKNFTQNSLRLACLMLLACTLACSPGDQTDKARTLANEGDAAVEAGNNLDEEANTKGKNVYAAVSPSQYPEGRDGVKGLAQESIDAYEKSAAKYREAAAKYDEASKLNINDKLKEYLQLKAQAFSKATERAEAAGQRQKAFLESNDFTTLQGKLTEIKTKTDTLTKDFKDLFGRAKLMEEAYKEIIKP